MYDWKEQRFTKTPTTIISKSQEAMLTPEQAKEYAEVRRRLSGKFTDDFVTFRITKQDKKALLQLAYKNEMYSLTDLFQSVTRSLLEGEEVGEIVTNLTHGLEESHH